MKKYTVDIIGSCVSRDSLFVGGLDNDFEVKSFYQECNPLIQFTQHIVPDITFDDIPDKYVLSNFQKKCVCTDINKDMIQTLEKSGAEWLILDSFMMGYGITKVNVGGGHSNT